MKTEREAYRKYFRVRYSNRTYTVGYTENGHEIEEDAPEGDVGWCAKTKRVPITEEEYHLLREEKLNLMEPYPTVPDRFWENFEDTEGNKVKLGDWLTVYCDSLTFKVRFHLNHEGRMVPFDTYAWWKIEKAPKQEVSPPWKNFFLEKSYGNMNPDRPQGLDALKKLIRKQDMYTNIQQVITDYLNKK